VSSDAEIAEGITAAMKEFGWSRIALLTQSENIFTFVSSYIVMLNRPKSKIQSYKVFIQRKSSTS